VEVLGILPVRNKREIEKRIKDGRPEHQPSSNKFEV